MPKAPKLGKCVHCLSDPVARNWDHVFPKSWYPDETPANLEKWQVPSCVPCNSKYGKIESDLLGRMGLCLDPEHPASRSIVQAALRSMNPKAGRDERDGKLRHDRGKRILSQALHGADIPTGSTIPGMEEKWNRPVEEQVAILVSATSLRLMTEKVVRGIFYVEDGRFIEPPYKIDFFVLDGDSAQQWKAILNKFGIIYAREPGVSVHRAVVPEDRLSSMFEVTFWQQFKLYASVSADDS